jgi:hypothetical protein
MCCYSNVNDASWRDINVSNSQSNVLFSFFKTYIFCASTGI